MDTSNDLTQGRVTSGLLGFFFPMLFTNLLQQVYSVADTAIVGKGLGDYAVGAVGNLSSLSLFIIGFSMGMTNGFAVIIGQNFGSGDKNAVRRSIGQSVKLSCILTVILTVTGITMLKPILLMMKTDERIITGSLTYGYIIFGGLFATVAYNLGSGILRALGDSRTPFIAIMISSAVNIASDCILIFVFRTGVGGAAAATVLSQGLSALICFIGIYRMNGRCHYTKHSRDTESYALLLKNGIPMACTNSVTAAGCMVVQRYVNSCGAGYTSAYSVCSRYLNLFMLPSLTAGFAVSAFVSQNLGAGKKERIRDGVRVSTYISAVSYVILGSVMVFLPEILSGLMLNELDTISLSSEYLKICGIFLILLNLLFIYRNAVQGMGHPLIPMISGIAEMALRIPVIIFLLPSLGFSAAAIAEGAAWAGALALNIGAYKYYYNKI